MDAETTWPPQPYRKDHSRRFRDILESEMDLRAVLGQPVSRRVLARHLCSEAGCAEAEARAFVREYCDHHGLLRWTVWHSAQAAILSVLLCAVGVVAGWEHRLMSAPGHGRSRAALHAYVHGMEATLCALVLAMFVAVSALVVVSLLERAAAERSRAGEQ